MAEIRYDENNYSITVRDIESELKQYVDNCIIEKELLIKKYVNKRLNKAMWKGKINKHRHL